MLRIRNTLTVAGAILVATIAARSHWKLESAEPLDLRPAKAWPEPNLAFDLNPLSGPALVIVEYSVNLEQTAASLEAMRELRTARQRDGAFQSGLFVDTAEPIKHIEEFMVESWVEHLRQHARLTVFR